MEDKDDSLMSRDALIQNILTSIQKADDLQVSSKFRLLKTLLKTDSLIQDLISSLTINTEVFHSESAKTIRKANDSSVSNYLSIWKEYLEGISNDTQKTTILTRAKFMTGLCRTLLKTTPIFFAMEVKPFNSTIFKILLQEISNLNEHYLDTFRAVACYWQLKRELGDSDNNDKGKSGILYNGKKVSTPILYHAVEIENIEVIKIILYEKANISRHSS